MKTGFPSNVLDYKEEKNSGKEQVIEIVNNVTVLCHNIRVWVIISDSTLTQRRSASILSARFRVSEKGPIKLCQRGVWLCLRVRSAGKVFRSDPKLLKSDSWTLSAGCFMRYALAKKSSWHNLQPAGLRWHWQLESKQLDANQLTAASICVTATSWAGKPSRAS